MLKTTRIFVIGHPGAGKALIAQEVAKKVGWKFIDADFGLEFHMGRTLPEILSETGAHAFHQAETVVLQQLLQQDNIVVTTDASIIFNKEVKQLLKDEMVVYLTVSAAVQLERWQHHNTSFLSMEHQKTFFDKLHVERDRLYEEIATTLVNSDDGAVEKHVMQITEAIKK